MRTRCLIFLALLLLAMPGQAQVGAQPRAQAETRPSQRLLWVGTYTDKASKGIYAWRFDSETGRAETLGLAADTRNPSFLAIHPSGRYVFAVNELSTFQGQPSGAVSAFRVDDANGKLSFINQIASGGADPCYIAIDPGGNSALVSNYTGGSVTVLPIATDGRLGQASAHLAFQGIGVNPARQEAPHAHSINLTPDGRFALVADLGMDLIRTFQFEPRRGLLTPGDIPFARSAPGAGPRHLAFHPNGHVVYVLNELHSSLTMYAYDPAAGSLLERQTISTLPSDFKGANTAAEVRVHPSGRFVYASNRGHDSIAVFSIDAAKGTLTAVQTISSGGKTPRNFVLDPTGRWLLAANQASDNVVVFKVDATTGKLTPSGEGFKVPAPVCLRFLAKN